MSKQLITTQTLNRVRRVNQAAMDKTATVLTKGTPTADGYGGETVTYTAVNSYQCRFRPANYAERQQLQAGQPMTDSPFVAVLPWDAEIAEDARLRIDGNEYEIVGWLGSKSHKVDTKVALREVQPETIRENVPEEDRGDLDE